MSDNNKIKKPLRSAQWFGTRDKNGFMYRSWMKNQGIPDHHFQGKPVIGICNTWSELTPCNAHFRELAERVHRGVLEAGGVPVEFPVFSSGESNLRPTAMLTRNLASMDVEESIRGNPLDGVVLLAGCDKTTPALLMGAASCDLPSIVVSGSPMLNGKPSRSLWDNNRDAPCYDDAVIRSLDNPVCASGGICTLRGNLAPRGAVLKPSAATPALMHHRGRALVFENFNHYKSRILDPDLDMDPDSILVLKICGPKGYPGMAEVGNMGLPPKLLKQGVTDMLRISDARMSGTAFGTVVLHIAPEAIELGPLAAVQDGDYIYLDADKGLLELELNNAEINARLAQLRLNQIKIRTGGYLQLYIDHVCKLMRVAISISWWAAAAPGCPDIRTSLRTGSAAPV